MLTRGTLTSLIVITWESAYAGPVSTVPLNNVIMMWTMQLVRCFTDKPKLHNTPMPYEKPKIHIPTYITAFTDGEGCFCVSTNKNAKHKTGWEVRPSFSVSQNKDRAQVLYLMKKYFGCGTIRPDRSDKTLKYEVRSLNDLLTKIIPHFENYPLLSTKNRSFKLFKQVCFMMKNHKHKSVKGLEKIFVLSRSINGESKAKI